MQLDYYKIHIMHRTPFMARCTRWFSPGTPVSSTDKSDRHDITEILLKVALNTINQTNQNCIRSGKGCQVCTIFTMILRSMPKILLFLTLPLKKVGHKQSFYNPSHTPTAPTHLQYRRTL